MTLITTPEMRRQGYEKLCRLVADSHEAGDLKTMEFWLARYRLFRDSTYHDAQPIFREIMNTPNRRDIGR